MPFSRVSSVSSGSRGSRGRSTRPGALRRRAVGVLGASTLGLALLTGAAGASVAAASPAGNHPGAGDRGVARLAAGGARSLGLTNPPASIHPSRDFKIYCFVPGHVAQCNQQAVIAIDAARAKEGLGHIHLPSNFSRLGVTAQLTVVSNRERGARGLPAMNSSTTLDRMAQTGAREGRDPTGPSGHSWGSNISWGYATPLAADFGWMYDDGTNSPNVGCTRAGARGCWGHRDNILNRWHGRQGNGAYTNHGVLQLTELFVQNY